MIVSREGEWIVVKMLSESALGLLEGRDESLRHLQIDLREFFIDLVEQEEEEEADE